MSPPETFDGYRKTGIDSEIDERLAAHCATHNLSPLDGVKFFPVLARRQWLKRFLAHTELFKLTIEIPGDIAELGVFRGAGLMTWANLLEAYMVGDRTKVVYGFDNWKGFTGFSPQDGVSSDELQKTVGGFSPGNHLQELKDAIAIYDADRFVPWKPRVKLIEGQIEDSVPAFVRDNPGIRFSLVHFDCDLYKPTLAALEAIYSKVSRGGVILFDEYSIKEWAGETQAVDEFIASRPELQLRKFQWTNAPAAYLIKP